MSTSKIKWYHVTKGYGFITLDDDGADVFLYVSQLEKLNIFPNNRWDVEGMSLKYDIKLDSKGRRIADNISVMEEI
ncbi:MAG: cold shock domain-containing protein [Candidatus Falkowbacteria bacterium]